MKTFHAIIAGARMAERNEIRRFLEGSGLFSAVRYATDSVSCVHEALSFSPDVVIADHRLDGADSLNTFKELDRAGITVPVRVMISDLSPAVRKYCAGAGVTLIGSPFKPLEVVRQVFRQLPIPEKERNLFSDSNLENTLWDMFMEMGAPIHLRGFSSAIAGILMVFQDKSCLDNMTNRLYPGIGQDREGFNWKTTEKRIRDFNNAVFTRGNLQVVDRYFGTLSRADQAGVNNSTFMAVMANQLMFRLKEQVTRSDPGDPGQDQ